MHPELTLKEYEYKTNYNNYLPKINFVNMIIFSNEYDLNVISLNCFVVSKVAFKKLRLYLREPWRQKNENNHSSPIVLIFPFAEIHHKKAYYSNARGYIDI